MKAANTIIGILAHVDAGKTTLSESILYQTGALRRKGRVDHGDAFLDTDQLEKKRGITIFSKLARFSLPEHFPVDRITQGTEENNAARPFTLLDTPGHVDFSPEMERTLHVLDLAILVISASDGVTPQVRLLWKLLQHYQVPAFVFVNKMDLVETGNTAHDAAQQERLLQEITRELGNSIVPFGRTQLSTANEEAIAVCDERLMEHVLDGGHITQEDVIVLVKERKLHPLYFGSALKDCGTTDLLSGIAQFTWPMDYPDDFGALVYKVTREEGKNGARLTWMKLTGGRIAVRDTITQRRLAADEEAAQTEEANDLTITEKITGIRLYSGSHYEAVTQACAGEVVAVTGLSSAAAGDGLGIQAGNREELLSPIMTCQVIPAPGTDTFTLVQALRSMEEEEPMLHVLVNEETGDVTIQIMGEVQLQILRNRIEERFGFQVTFGQETIVYKETIRNPVEGVGHFEPLRHYAEVHLLLEPTAPGSGLTFENHCLPDMLDRNWQHLIMTHLQEKSHKGVLTGSDITDMRISLIGGKASKKHTVGGDFRQATYRAVRQGLMMAESILLEPVLAFQLIIPKEDLGRALNDISARNGKAAPAVFNEDTAILEGTAPASEFGGYAQEVAAYTSGQGKLSVSFKDYEPCHNAQEVIDRIGYDPEADLKNPSSSVFCSHGAGTVVPWQEVRQYMQVDTFWQPHNNAPAGADSLSESSKEGIRREVHAKSTAAQKNTDFAEQQRRLEAGEKELRAIFEATYGPIRENLHHPENEKYFSLDTGKIAGQAEETAAQKDNQSRTSAHNHVDRTNGTSVAQPKASQGTGKTGQAQDRQAEEYLLVDGYNIIFAWAQLRELAATDIKAARDRLLDIMGNYAGFSRETVIVVFDAYHVPGGTGEVIHLPSLDVVYTKEAETADLYIEKTAHKLTRHHRVTVATSDAVEQVIIYGSGAIRLSARGLLEQVLAAEELMREKYISSD